MKPTLILIASLLPGAATAAVPAWKIQEVYSITTGDVQFVKLVAATDGQNALSGQTLTFTTGATVVKSVTFAKNVTTNTANHSFLIGTASLRTLYGVKPDLVIPAAFLAAGADNFIDYANGKDRGSLAALPGDGVIANNNLSPIYGTDDRIIFATDLPHERQAHLYPQLDEYEEAPTTTGLWSLDPVREISSSSTTRHRDRSRRASTASAASSSRGGITCNATNRRIPTRSPARTITAPSITQTSPRPPPF